MPKVYIDGKEYEVQGQRNMLQVVLDNKLDLPYFCWHPAMGSVGACRQCAVKLFRDESDTKGKIAMACMTPAVEGTRISISDPEAREFRRHVIEWLMINHPHDCPICDEGGECHLQDMTAMTGHVYRRYREKKRTHHNQDLGPFVNHEMNRCIQCYRCVRFYRDYAGGHDLNVFGCHDHIYFGRAEDGVLESEFSGNLVEVCPTGVFTDKMLKKHYTRKWDLDTAPSVCIHCGIGCNTIPGARYEQLRRVYARYNSTVNRYFLCDRGRYGYEFVNHPDRIRECLARTNTGLSQTSWKDALDHAKKLLQKAKGVIGIGSPRASLEADYALRKLVGPEWFSDGLSDYEHEGAEFALDILMNGSVPTPSLSEVESADAVLILGVDPTNEAPMLDLAIRRAMHNSCLETTRTLGIPDWNDDAVDFTLQSAKGNLFTATPWPIKLEEIASTTDHLSPPDMVDFANNICEAIASSGAGPSPLTTHDSRLTTASAEGEESSSPFTERRWPKAGGEVPPDSQHTLASRIASAFRAARQPLIITGIAAGKEVLSAAYAVAQALRNAGANCRLTIIVPEANTMGIAMMGGMSAGEALRRLESADADTCIVLENDLSRRLSPQQFKHLSEGIKNLIVLDCMATLTSKAAGVVLPVRAYIESNGTFVNNEGRAQRYYQVFVPKGEARPSWQVIRDLGTASEWSTGEDVLRELAAEIPIFAPALEAAPPSDWRSPAGQKIARKSHRYSGRTAKDAADSVFEPQPPEDPDTPFAFSMEGEQTPPPGPLIPRFWSPGWNSVNSVTKFQVEVNGQLQGGTPGKRLIEPSGESASSTVPRREGKAPSAPANLPLPAKADSECNESSSPFTERRWPKAGGEVTPSSTLTTHDSPLTTVWLISHPCIFGSDELSSFSAGIACLTPAPKIMIHPQLAERLGLADGQEMELHVDGEIRHFPVQLNESIALDVAGIPASLPETIWLLSPEIITLI